MHLFSTGPLRLSARTLGSHPSKSGSIPLGGAINSQGAHPDFFFFVVVFSGDFQRYGIIRVCHFQSIKNAAKPCNDKGVPHLAFIIFCYPVSESDVRVAKGDGAGKKKKLPVLRTVSFYGCVLLRDVIPQREQRVRPPEQRRLPQLPERLRPQRH